jgi:hypothetical protein
MKMLGEYGSLPLHWGAAVHAGLEAHYLGKDRLEVARAADAAYQIPIPEGENLYTVDNLQKLLSAYPNWAKQNDGDMEVLATELYGEIKVGDGKFQVIIDTVVKTPSGIWSLEHKTTKKPLSQFYWNQFEPSGQISAQSAYIKQEFGQCSGVIVNALSVAHAKKPASPLLEVGDEECENYSQVEVKYSKFHGRPMAYCQGFHWKGGRQIFNRSEQQLQDWRENTQKAEALLKFNLDAYGPDSQWDKNEGQCGFCDFRDLCIGCGSEAIREIMYEKHDPYTYLNNRKEEGEV